MKFLCPQCKAKYQIADDKIEGRTLRMKCRRCEHEIVVKGDLAIAESEPPPPNRQPAQPVGKAPIAGRPVPAARPAAAPSVGARKPVGAALAAPAAAPAARSPAPRGAGSALGADFRRQMSAGAAEPARTSAATPLDAWHVAIHEVPVGPMKREELARKIATGAVTGESLCWREGFDDWRPLRDVAELSPLLRRPTNPPPAARPAAPGRGAPAAGRPVPAARPGAAPVRGGGSSAAQRPAAAPSSGARAAAPAARSNVVPIGGRLGAAAAPAFEDQPDEDFDEATVVAQSPLDAERLRSSAPDTAALGALVASSPPPAAAAATFEAPMFAPPSSPPPAHVAYSEPPRRRKTAISPIVWIAIAGASTFGMTLAAMVFTKLFQQPTTPAVALVAPPVAPTENGAPQAPIEIPDEATPPVAAPSTPEETPAGTAGHTPTKRGTPGTPTPATGGRQLTAAQQAEIDRMTGGGSGGTNLAPPTRAGGSDGPAVQAAELSAAQLRAVVQRNRAGLQHCYEMAARQTGSSETMRANVEIAVGGSGVVTRVSATGPTAPAQLTTCLEGAVRRWHFPAGGEAVFPVVFSPGGT